MAFRLPSTINNPDLKVEVSKEFEIGTDITFNSSNGTWFSNIALSGTYWTRKGEDIIYNVSAAPSTGAITNKNNALFLSSKGIQASLNLSVFKSKNFTYDFTANFGRQSSKIDRIIGGDIILTTSAGSTSLVLTEGQKNWSAIWIQSFTPALMKQKKMVLSILQKQIRENFNWLMILVEELM
ncbi:MAG: hypothetical protein WKF59_11075 [Chitinophagaceae bacterium]